MPTPETPQPADTPTKDDLKHAFKAFKKKLKLTRLDDESKIAGGPLTGGRKAETMGVTPPSQFSQAVWDELVKRGKMKHVGHGIYELLEE